MAVEPVCDPAGSLPARLFISALLIFSYFSVWIGSVDPWWRSKEWMTLVVGASWLVWRSFRPQQPIRRWNSLPLTFLLGWIVLQMFIIQIFPIIKAGGALMGAPWPWLTFLHIIILSIWMTDLIRCASHQDIEYASWLMAGIAVILASYMILQRFELDPLMWLIKHEFGKVTWLLGNHVVGLVGNPFQAGACLAVLVPAVVAKRLHIGSILCAVALIFTQSASAIVAALLGCLYVLWKQARDLTWKLLIAASVISGIRLMRTDWFDAHNRVAIWKVSLKLWLHHPFIGVGLSNYKMANLVDPTPPGYALRWAHNEWIQLGAELGLIGFLLCLWWADRLGRRIKRDWRQIPEVWIGTGITCLGLTFLSIPWHIASTIVVSVLVLIALEIHTTEVHLNG